jgi:hypothetical protein
MNIEIGAGIQALVGRMESNPEEFFDEAPRWRFMFADRFRDTMTESEKGAIHAALKEVRRKEFEHKVMRTLLEGNLKEQAMSAIAAVGQSTGTYTYDPKATLSIGAATSSSSTLRIGSESLTEADLRALKEATISRERFK